MKDNNKNKWENHYQSCTDNFPSAAEVLSINQHLLPKKAIALDLACGRGANAICLAENNLNTHAWDISSSALELLVKQAKKKSLTINTETRDVSANPPNANSFDIVVVSRFLDRSIIDAIKSAVKRNGLIFYQTFTKEKVNTSGPSNPEYLLDKNELLHFFDDWNILFYKEEGLTGNINLGSRNQAMIVAQNNS